MYLIWYTRVRRGQSAGAAENSARFLSHECWYRAGARVAERIGAGRAQCDRERSVACPVALAGGHASLPSDGKRSVGSANRPAKEIARRVLICLYQDHLVALHGFIKKTRATREADLALARKRQKEL